MLIKNTDIKLRKCLLLKRENGELRNKIDQLESTSNPNITVELLLRNRIADLKKSLEDKDYEIQSLQNTLESKDKSINRMYLEITDKEELIDNLKYTASIMAKNSKHYREKYEKLKYIMNSKSNYVKKSIDFTDDIIKVYVKHFEG